jgi:MFS family permease
MALSNRDSRWKTIMLALVIAEVASAFEVSMVFSGLPTFYKLFQDPALVGWVITAYLLVGAAASAICGRIGDLYGRSRVLIGLLFFAALGSLISAISTSLEGIVFGRAVQGLASAILPLCFGLVRENISSERTPLCIGILAGTASTAAGVGFLLGGVCIDYLSWHWIFYISTVASVLGLLLVIAFLPSSAGKASEQKIDILGGVLFAPAVAGILFALTKASAWGWYDQRTLLLGFGSLALLAFWAWYEARHSNPLIDVRLFANRQLAMSNLCYVFIALGAMQFAQVLFVLMQQPTWTGVGLGMAATAAAAMKLPSSLVAIFASPWAGVLAGRFGGRKALLCGLSILVVGWAALTVHHSNVWFVGFAIILHGIGTAMAFSAVPNLIVEAVPPQRVSEVTGLSQVIRTTFMAIGAQMIAFILATQTISDPAQGPGTYPAGSAFQLAFLVITVLCIFSMFAAMALPKRGANGAREAAVQPAINS